MVFCSICTISEALPRRYSRSKKLKKILVFCSLNRIFARRTKRKKIMSIDTYKLTSMEEPTDEVLSQLMREAAEEARETNAQATQRYFDELRQAAANIR